MILLVSTNVALIILKAQPMIHLHSLINKVLAFVYIVIAVVSSMSVAHGLYISIWMMIISVDLVIVDSSSSSSTVALIFSAS